MPKSQTRLNNERQCYERIVKGLQDISLDLVRYWKIYGEDPNCDFGGHHSTPYLCTVKGTFEQAWEYAIELRAFWQWGAGGDIRPAVPNDIVDLTRGNS